MKEWYEVWTKEKKSVIKSIDRWNKSISDIMKYHNLRADPRIRRLKSLL